MTINIAEEDEGYVPETASELRSMEWKTIAEIVKLDKELWTELVF